MSPRSDPRQSFSPATPAPFDHAVADVFTLEDALARDLSEALDLQLSDDWAARRARRGTTDLGAHKLALAAHREFFRFNPPAFPRAIALADQAIARDPNYPLPHFVRAVAYLNLPASGAAVRLRRCRRRNNLRCARWNWRRTFRTATQRSRWHPPAHVHDGDGPDG